MSSARLTEDHREVLLGNIDQLARTAGTRIKAEIAIREAAGLSEVEGVTLALPYKEALALGSLAAIWLAIHDDRTLLEMSDEQALEIYRRTQTAQARKAELNN